jgi:hypothetical protein
LSFVLLDVEQYPRAMSRPRQLRREFRVLNHRTMIIKPVQFPRRRVETKKVCLELAKPRPSQVAKRTS